ncbi:MAG TPA: DUF2723 domain-containing protein [Gemmatimonadaceae bacterium]|nr:DUF2723 domain-containing protein [Gemmatimonadaceae bacterium]
MPKLTRSACATGLGVAVFALYLVTLSPSAAMWDAGEYIAAVKSLGVPHQPGNPLFVLIGHAFALLPLSARYAVRVNILAALASAVTAALWFLCAEWLLRDRISDDAQRFGASACAALLGATAFTVWNQSVVMEKVYPIALVALALTSWLMLRWLELDAGRRADRMLVLIAYLVGLGYAIHPAGLLTAPSVAIAVIARRPRTLLRWKFIGVLAGALLLGATPFAVLPIRAAYQPFINESAVSACESGTLHAACTFSGETARRLTGVIQREQYGGNPVAERRAPFVAQVQMYWLYFKWQWLRDVKGELPVLQSLIAATMLLLGLLGLWSLRRNDSTSASPSVSGAFWYFAPLAATFTIALIYYLNFRYGWSQSPELGNAVPREPRDRDYFYMWTFSLWGLLAGLGLVWLWRRRTAAVLAFALVPLVGNWTAASRKGQSFTREWASDMLSSVEPNAVLITNGDNDSFPLWYAQEVEGIRRDVTVALTPYLGIDWYARQLNRRAHIWKLTDQELDTIPPYLESAAPMQFHHASINTVIPPGYLTRDQLLVLRAIKDSFPNRPIYFSFGPYGRPLGLDPYLERVGLVQKLMPTPVRDDPDTARTPSGAYIDVEKSLALWQQYRAPAQLLREGRWVDAASADVPLYYAQTAQDLALALDARGDHARADQIIEDVKRIVAVVQ